MACEGCNCGRARKEVERRAEEAKRAAEAKTAYIETRSLTCEEEYQTWLERAESLGIRLLEE